MKNSIRLASGLMLLVVLIISNVSCKKENATSNSPIVGKWLMYQTGNDGNENGKLEDSEWTIFTKDDYEFLKFLGITGEVVFNGDGTGKLVASQGDSPLFKWSIKADGSFEITDLDPNAGVFKRIAAGDTEKLFIDAKGDLSYEAVEKTTTNGVTSTIASGSRYKRN